MKPEAIRTVLRENYPRFCTVVLKDGRRYRTRVMRCVVTDYDVYISHPKGGKIVPVDQVVRVLAPRRPMRNRSNHRGKAAKAS